jgi:methylated-DNA-[protein]-cysteine S-methyltransferase
MVNKHVLLYDSGMNPPSNQPTAQAANQRHQGYCKTPWGNILLDYDQKTIYRFEFISTREIKFDSSSQTVCDAFINNPKAFKLAPEGTYFQQLVWAALQKIPRGTMRSYLDVAKMIGKPQSVRAVANAIGANPICIFIPCHRVIKSDGTLGGFSSGISLKKKLLLEEGINPPSEGPSHE